KEGGVLILAIENQLGIKYWSGAAEDHSGRIFDGIVGYPVGKSAKTFSRKNLLKLLNQVGMEAIEQHFPFPDYKIPVSVVSETMVEKSPTLVSDLVSHQPFQNYGAPRVIYFPESLALRPLAEAGLLGDFSNSFLMVASRSAQNPTWNRLL